VGHTPDYRYIIFRITQVYEPTLNPDGTPRNFHVRIHSLNGNDRVPISEHGGALHFPVKKPAPGGAIQEEQTKNAMQSYLIPLRAFEGVNLSSVTAALHNKSELRAQLRNLEYLRCNKLVQNRLIVQSRLRRSRSTLVTQAMSQQPLSLMTLHSHSNAE
jgi:hypothetical protein